MRFEKKVELLRTQKYKGIETPEFLLDVSRIAEGEPFEYILGQVDFAGARIDLSFHPMIPRPETEFWVKKVIEEIKAHESAPQRVLDIFSGSGCVGIAIAKNIPDTHVDLIELDPALKVQMEKNIGLNILASRVHAVSGDTFVGATGLYDVITAVPPYVRPSNKEEVMKELKGEPELAFFDKEDGTYFHKKVLEEAKAFLQENGILYMEADNDQVDGVKACAEGLGWKIKDIWNDPYGNPYLLVLGK